MSLFHHFISSQAGREENFEVEEDKAVKDAQTLYNVSIGNKILLFKTVV